jgi:hypothetical protein
MPSDCPTADQTQQLSLILAMKDSQLTPTYFLENLQLFNCVASHWGKPGALRQQEVQKRTDDFIKVFS